MKRLDALKIDRAQKTLALILGGLLLMLLGGWALLWQQYQADDKAHKDLTPRVARLLGIQQFAPQIEEELSKRRSSVGEDILPASIPTSQASTDMLQRVRRIVEQSGLILEGTQNIAPVIKPGFQEIPMTITAQGSLESLLEALHSLQVARPRIHVQRLVIQPVRPRQGESGQTVRVELRVSILRMSE